MTGECGCQNPTDDHNRTRAVTASEAFVIPNRQCQNIWTHSVAPP